MSKERFFSMLKGELSRGTWEWMVIVFATSMIMIYNSHKIDEKVHQTTKLIKQVRELKAQYIEGHSKLMNVKRQSDIERKVKPIGLTIPEYPPVKIITNHE